MRYFRFALPWLFLAASASSAAIDRPPSDAQVRAADAAVVQFTRPTLTRFAGEKEFAEYAEAVRDSAKAHGNYWARAASKPTLLGFAQATAPGSTAPAEPECPKDKPDCHTTKTQDLVVTGSRMTPRNASITNNQMRGVEEGDIVKQVDRFLLVLSDGRVFVIDTGGDKGRRLKLVDVANVYRDPAEDMWYDEMLVLGDRILVTGYSYREGATELSVLKLGPDGRLVRQGTFMISSNDYYSTSNYATRLIGDNLVVYTPFNLISMTSAPEHWPLIRRWHEKNDDQAAGTRLFDAAAIYKPLQTDYDPTVHTVSVCPLNSSDDGRNLECRTTAFIGSPAAEWYVTVTDAFVWTGAPSTASGDWPDRECSANDQFAPGDFNPALIYRIGHASGLPTVVAARGAPIDQFSMQSTDSGFHSLLRLTPTSCYENWSAAARLSYFSAGMDRFRNGIEPVRDTDFTALPGTGTRWIANRFSDRYLVYGSLSQYRRGPPNLSGYSKDGRQRARAQFAIAPVFVVPIDRPKDLTSLDVGHTVIRAEQFGDHDIVLAGYRDRSGLIVTRLALTGTPRVGSSVKLEGRFESEGRSHAFNGLVERDGRGLMGVPTVPQRSQSGRWWWRSVPSDVSFIRMASSGSLAPLGELTSKLVHDKDDDDGIRGYSCEVSCVDWYGNSRPIFTDGRIFALSGGEIIEGQIGDGAIEEVQRINFARDSTRLANLRTPQASAR